MRALWMWGLRRAPCTVGGLCWGVRRGNPLRLGGGNHDSNWSLLDSSVLALPLGLVGREIGLGCVLGTCFKAGVGMFFYPCSCCMEVWVGCSRCTSYFPVSGGGLTYGTSDQYVSLSFIGAGGVQPSAWFFSSFTLPLGSCVGLTFDACPGTQQPCGDAPPASPAARAAAQCSSSVHPHMHTSTPWVLSVTPSRSRCRPSDPLAHLRQCSAKSEPGCLGLLLGLSQLISQATRLVDRPELASRPAPPVYLPHLCTSTWVPARL